jgi:hypothetical protein
MKTVKINIIVAETCLLSVAFIIDRGIINTSNDEIISISKNAINTIKIVSRIKNIFLFF